MVWAVLRRPFFLDPSGPSKLRKRSYAAWRLFFFRGSTPMQRGTRFWIFDIPSGSPKWPSEGIRHICKTNAFLHILKKNRKRRVRQKRMREHSDYAGNQSVKARNYYNLEIDGTNNSHVKSVVNSFTVDNNLTVSLTSAFDVLDKTIIVTGASDVNGILNINGSGVLDANGAFDATGGNINMDGTARLQLNSTVTSLGTLDAAAGTVEYDQDGTQTILSAHTYYDLEIDGSGSKSTDGTPMIYRKNSLKKAVLFLISAFIQPVM